MTKIAFIVTVPISAAVLLRGQLADLRAHGFDVTVISSPGPELDLVREREGVRVIAVPMAREISAVADAKALAVLTKELRALRPDIVNASTAKAGLLGMMAATIARVPRRIYLLRGLRLETERGAKRAVLGMTERIAAGCAHRVICVSESLRERYVAEGFAPAEKCAVLGSGSSNGVEIARFTPTEARRAEAAKLRADLGISPTAPVIGFIGRPVRDKGMVELLEAFDRTAQRHPAARLVVVGVGFAEDEIDAKLAARKDVILVPRVAEPAPYYAMMDVLAFPSHREGFPNAPLEAAAAGVPTVGSRATGVRDAVADGSTGILVDIGDAHGLAEGLLRYLGDPGLRKQHGANAQGRAAAKFARETVWASWRAEYQVPSNSGI